MPEAPPLTKGLMVDHTPEAGDLVLFSSPIDVSEIGKIKGGFSEEEEEEKKEGERVRSATVMRALSQHHPP